MVSGFGSGLVGKVGGGVWVGIGLRVGNWQFSSNFLLAFANLLLGMVASISGSFFCVCFLGVGNLGWVRVGNPAGVGVGNGFRVDNFFSASCLWVAISSLHMVLIHLLVPGSVWGWGWVVGWAGVGFGAGKWLRVGVLIAGVDGGLAGGLGGA